MKQRRRNRIQKLQKKQRKAKRTCMNDKHFYLTMHGMFKSVDIIVREIDNQMNLEDPLALVPGHGLAAIILAAHCAELSLKYKIQLQEGDFPTIHNLWELYEELNTKTKSEIQDKYNENRNPHMSDKWNNVEYIFKQCQNAPIYGRYAVASEKMALTYFAPLLTAANSVFRTTPGYNVRFTRTGSIAMDSEEGRRIIEATEMKKE